MRRVQRPGAALPGSKSCTLPITPRHPMTAIISLIALVHRQKGVDWTHKRQLEFVATMARDICSSPLHPAGLVSVPPDRAGAANVLGVLSRGVLSETLRDIVSRGGNTNFAKFCEISCKPPAGLM